MRVIAGEYRSRRLLSVEGLATRPTPDRLRETLFSILGAEVEGSVFVDAYAGTGSVGIEALSRGARLAIFLEKDRRALEAIRRNLSTLGAEARARVLPGAASASLKGIAGADIVFLDPPYDKEHEYNAVLGALSANPPGLTIVQHSIRFEPPETGLLVRGRVVKQGDNALSFYRGQVRTCSS
jgi:16S rRNA (guanine(966)-N(2))-methyltransferase RsmD